MMQDPEAIKQIQATEREDHAKLFDAAGSHSITHIRNRKGLEVTVRRRRFDLTFILHVSLISEGMMCKPRPVPALLFM